MSDLISIGGARLRSFGLRPVHVGKRSERRLPGAPTFRAMDYQDTGIGERTTQIDGETLPHFLGGMDAVALLEAHHLAGSVVYFVRMAAQFLAYNQGRVIIRTLDIDEEQLHPADGVGRVVRARIELVHVDTINKPFG